jgi:hypothetical protein
LEAFFLFKWKQSPASNPFTRRFFVKNLTLTYLSFKKLDSVPILFTVNRIVGCTGLKVLFIGGK